MQDITGMFMLLAGKTDWMFRVSLIAELVPLVKKCYINLACLVRVSCNSGNVAGGVG